MRRYLIDVDDFSPTTVTEILPTTCELRWDFLEQERMKQYSRDKYFFSVKNQGYQSSRRTTQNLVNNIYTHKSKYLHPTRKGLSIPLVVNCKDQISL